VGSLYPGWVNHMKCISGARLFLCNRYLVGLSMTVYQRSSR